MNENKLNAMINWYLTNCKEKEEGIKDRKKRMDHFNQLTKEQILYFTEEELKQNILNKEWLFASRVGLANSNILNKNDFEKLKENLVYLLYGNDEMEIKWTTLLKNVDYFSNSFMTELLAITFPKKYVIFNEVTKKIFSYLEIDTIPLKKELKFDEYKKVIAIIKKVKEQLEEKTGTPLNFLDVDNMFWFYSLQLDKKPDEPQTESKEIEKYYWLNTNPRIFTFFDKAIGFEQLFEGKNENGNLRDNFSNVKLFEKVFIYETGEKRILGIGKITKKSEDHSLTIKLIDSFEVPITLEELKSIKALEQAPFITSNMGTLKNITEEETKLILKLIQSKNELRDDSYSFEKLDKEVFLKKEECEKIYNILKEKKNIILEGAPGVGKTYIAKRLCYAIMRKKEEERLLNIQFHQSYAYEDFVLGYRPTKKGGFKLKSGPFIDFCEKARKDKKNEYFLIIDEINRGNISKIFGELLVLIENDKRDTYSVDLAYQGKNEDYKNFTIPSNLYIIGLMNTADRSLALMDFALRRRFAFYRINPLFEEEKFKTYAQNIPYLNDIIPFIKKLNDKIKDDESLGEGFMIGHSYFSNFKEKESKEEIKNKLELILEYEIEPMLKEYWYDEKDKLKDYTNLKSLIK